VIAMGLGIVALVVRCVRVPAERLAWGLLALGLSGWAAGEVYYTFVLWELEEVPLPSPADVGYLAFPVCGFAGIVVLARARRCDTNRLLAFDGLTAALAVGALSAAVVVQAVLNTVGGEAIGIATNLAYPLTDLLLLGTIVWVVGAGGWRPDRTWLLLGIGCVSFWVADSVYLVGSAAGWYDPDTNLADVGWYATAAMWAYASWQPAAARTAVLPRDGWWPILLPLGFAVLALGVLLVGALEALNPIAALLAAAALVASLVRLALTFRENAAMLLTSRGEALTDALTSLGNRRALLLDLDTALAAADERAPLVLVLFDLDGFKHYNDAFGHPAGDALLTRLGHNLHRCLEGRGRGYRMGGDEFCALLRPGSEAPGPLVAAAGASLAEHGDGFSVGCSYGSIVLPLEASDAASALRIADGRMYAHKGKGRFSEGHQSRDVLLRALVERHPDLGPHTAEVGALAEAVAGRLSLGADEAAQIRRAAELHDVGKVAVPDAILAKPGPLDADEWGFVRRHTLIGERIVDAAPALGRIGQLVRWSHERFDGCGYPDGLAGDVIPLGARIIAVCDAFDAMTMGRPYRIPVTPEAALAELRACAGSQFDPAVVEAFCVAWAARAGEPRAQSATNLLRAA